MQLMILNQNQTLTHTA